MDILNINLYNILLLLILTFIQLLISTAGFHPGVDSLFEVLEGVGVVKVGATNHFVPQTAVVGQE